MRRTRLLLAAACALALAACGGGGEDVPSGSPLPVLHTLAPLQSTAPQVDAEFTVLPSGLQFATIIEGTGPEPVAGDKVAVNYAGWLKDGELFDSSISPGGKPFEFIVGQGDVIKGWDQGIPLMKVGGVYRLVIPPDLAYGARGSGPIPPNATLVFDVSLISTQHVTPTPSPTPKATVDSTPPPVDAEPVTTASGLQFITISEGTGDSPQPGDTVTLDYTGWVQGGGQFDTSIGRIPFSFPAGQGRTIDGFDEGVLLMRTGGSYRLIIPPELGYGDQGSPGYIGPNATLIFDITIVSIEPAAAP